MLNSRKSTKLHPKRYNWHDRDITFNHNVEEKHLEGQGVYFQRGPLLFSYAIPQQMTEDTEEYPNMHGKKPENPYFKCWNITPTGAFNYAYASDGKAIEVFYPTVEEVGGTIPFDLNYANVKLRIPVKQIAWDLVDGRYTPAMPEQGHLELLSNETQYIELVPYGCTELRLTVFHDAEAEAQHNFQEPDYTRPADAPDCVALVDAPISNCPASVGTRPSIVRYALLTALPTCKAVRAVTSVNS